MHAVQDDEIDALMARLADGDRLAFSLLFKQLWAPTQRFCMNMLKNEADASDAAQLAMEKILQRASDYDPARRALPWALAIAGWECRTLQRKRFRRGEMAEDAAGERSDDASEDELVRRDLTNAALAAMSELSATDRETLVATFWDETATASGATLRKRRERAIDRLRGAFRRLYGVD